MTQILLVGCGRMGTALLSGWLGAGVASRVVVVEPAGLGGEGFDERVLAVADRAAVPAEFAPDVVVLAVKPQVLDQAAPAYRDIVERGALVISIAAGKTLSRLAACVGEQAAIVRSMPNLPAAIGSGVTVCAANAQVSTAQQALCSRLLGTVGALEWVDDEALLDAVTAVSGNGPAYVFLVIEALAAAGAAAGLPEDLAMRLARATVSGAGDYVRQSPDSPEAMRRAVTSPAGTTAAALTVLMGQPGLQDLFDRAVAAAVQRSRELAG
ncbi:MAG TPA: pyrroline-5-carboxylate reductase [Stellaceae bacterium]|nr:pyrroline-5-carboxylate reductase [Stellaceae bacterium]